MARPVMARRVTASWTKRFTPPYQGGGSSSLSARCRGISPHRPHICPGFTAAIVSSAGQVRFEILSPSSETLSARRLSSRRVGHERAGGGRMRLALVGLMYVVCAGRIRSLRRRTGGKATRRRLTPASRAIPGVGGHAHPSGHPAKLSDSARAARPAGTVDLGRGERVWDRDRDARVPRALLSGGSSRGC